MNPFNPTVAPLAVALLVAVAIPGQTTAAIPVNPAITFAGQAVATTPASLADDARVGRFSGVIATTGRGDVQTLDARGSAVQDGSQANGPQVAYALGSVTKVLTATAVMRLVEEGRIDLAAPVETYLPEYAARPFAGVTIAQLLSHTGGVPSLFQTEQGLGDEAPNFDEISLPIGTSALIDQFSAAPLLFEPGAHFGYSNSGYILLGRIIEVVTGRPYFDALESLVLAPAGVSGEFCLCRDLSGRPDATAFERHADSLAPAPVIDPSQTFSAGGVRATPDGMLRWSEALMSGRILKPETLEQMWAPVTPTRNRGESIALGWLVRDVDGVRRVAHDGALPGSVSYLVLTPSSHRATFGSLNHTLDLEHLSDSEAYLRRVVSSVVSGTPAASVPALAVTSAGEALVGTYILPEGRVFMLRTDAEGQLWLETDGRWSSLQLPKLAYAEGPRATDAQAAITDWATAGQAAFSARFSPNMLANVPPGALDELWSQFTRQFGTYSRHHVYAATDNFAEVRIDFEQASLDIGIVFDNQGRIDGIQPVGQETEMPATRVRAWATADGGLWIDGFAYFGPDVAATLDQQGGLTFQSGQHAVRQPPQ